MKVVVQRVTEARVHVEGAKVAEIGPGLLLLVGFSSQDTAECIPPMVETVIKMRIFSDERGRFDESVLDTGGGILAVPQFTLFADTSQRRPWFGNAMKAEAATSLFDTFVATLRSTPVTSIEAGIFGANMQVSLVNDGPVTIIVEQ